MKLLFHGKTALITGSGSGLGRVYALELSKRGANIVVNDLPPSSATQDRPAESLVKYVNDNGGKAVLSYHDVLNGKDIVSDAIKAFGSVDILINNAGILRDKSFHKLPNDDWYKVINIHINGTFELCHNIWPYMQERNYGRIVNVSSAAGLYGNFGQSNYSTAKMGIIGLTNTLAIEGAKNNIHVNCIVPVAASKMTETVLPQNILDRLKPEHISPLVTYLSHEKCQETGNIYELGAGWYSQMRWQRTMGVTLGGDDTVATAESIEEHMRQIGDFSQASNPKTIAGSLGDMLEATSRGINAGPNATTLTPLPSTSTENASGVSFKTDRMFEKLAAMLASDRVKGKALTEAIQAKICLALSDANDTTIKEWYIDLSSSGPSLRVLGVYDCKPGNNQAERSKDPATKPDVKLYCSEDTFLSLARGDTSPEMAFMRGLFKVKGPVSIATRIRSLLDVIKPLI